MSGNARRVGPRMASGSTKRALGMEVPRNAALGMDLTVISLMAIDLSMTFIRVKGQMSNPAQRPISTAFLEPSPGWPSPPLRCGLEPAATGKTAIETGVAPCSFASAVALKGRCAGGRSDGRRFRSFGTGGDHHRGQWRDRPRHGQGAGARPLRGLDLGPQFVEEPPRAPRAPRMRG